MVDVDDHDVLVGVGCRDDAELLLCPAVAEVSVLGALVVGGDDARSAFEEATDESADERCHFLKKWGERGFGVPAVVCRFGFSVEL